MGSKQVQKRWREGGGTEDDVDIGSTVGNVLENEQGFLTEITA